MIIFYFFFYDLLTCNGAPGWPDIDIQFVPVHGLDWREGAGQETKVIQSYTRPVGRTVPMAGVLFSLLQVNRS